MLSDVLRVGGDEAGRLGKGMYLFGRRVVGGVLTDGVGRDDGEGHIY